jgi:signal transduction histidine kinase
VKAAAIQEQLFLMGRKAVMNALRYSQATKIAVEIQYRRDLVCVCVTDDGCGINSKAVLQGSDSHWGLRGVHEMQRKLCGTRHMEQDSRRDENPYRCSG